MHADPEGIRTMQAAARTRREPGTELRAALLAITDGLGELLHHSERAWASITFSGARHRVTMSFTGDEAVAAGERLVEALPEHEFAIPRQIVADAAVLAVTHENLPEPKLTVEAELLLLEDA